METNNIEVIESQNEQDIPEIKIKTKLEYLESNYYYHEIIKEKENSVHFIVEDLEYNAQSEEDQFFYMKQIFFDNEEEYLFYKSYYKQLERYCQTPFIKNDIAKLKEMFDINLDFQNYFEIVILFELGESDRIDISRIEKNQTTAFLKNICILLSDLKKIQNLYHGNIFLKNIVVVKGDLKLSGFKPGYAKSKRHPVWMLEIIKEYGNFRLDIFLLGILWLRFFNINLETIIEDHLTLEEIKKNLNEVLGMIEKDSSSDIVQKMLDLQNQKDLTIEIVLRDFDEKFILENYENYKIGLTESEDGVSSYKHSRSKNASKDENLFFEEYNSNFNSNFNSDIRGSISKNIGNFLQFEKNFTDKNPEEIMIRGTFGGESNNRNIDEIKKFVEQEKKHKEKSNLKSEIDEFIKTEINDESEKDKKFENLSDVKKVLIHEKENKIEEFKDVIKNYITNLDEKITFFSDEKDLENNICECVKNNEQVLIFSNDKVQIFQNGLKENIDIKNLKKEKYSGSFPVKKLTFGDHQKAIVEDEDEDLEDQVKIMEIGDSFNNDKIGKNSVDSLLDNKNKKKKSIDYSSEVIDKRMSHKSNEFDIKKSVDKKNSVDSLNDDIKKNLNGFDQNDLIEIEKKQGFDKNENQQTEKNLKRAKSKKKDTIKKVSQLGNEEVEKKENLKKDKKEKTKNIVKNKKKQNEEINDILDEGKKIKKNSFNMKIENKVQKKINDKKKSIQKDDSINKNLRKNKMAKQEQNALNEKVINKKKNVKNILVEENLENEKKISLQKHGPEKTKKKSLKNKIESQNKEKKRSISKKDNNLSNKTADIQLISFKEGGNNQNFKIKSTKNSNQSSNYITPDLEERKVISLLENPEAFKKLIDKTQNVDKEDYIKEVILIEDNSFDKNSKNKNLEKTKGNLTNKKKKIANTPLNENNTKILNEKSNEFKKKKNPNVNQLNSNNSRSPSNKKKIKTNHKITNDNLENKATFDKSNLNKNLNDNIDLVKNDFKEKDLEENKNKNGVSNNDILEEKKNNKVDSNNDILEESKNKKVGLNKNILEEKKNERVDLNKDISEENKNVNINENISEENKNKNFDINKDNLQEIKKVSDDKFEENKNVTNVIDNLKENKEEKPISKINYSNKKNIIEKDEKMNIKKENNTDKEKFKNINNDKKKEEISLENTITSKSNKRNVKSKSKLKKEKSLEKAKLTPEKNKQIENVHKIFTNRPTITSLISPTMNQKKVREPNLRKYQDLKKNKKSIKNLIKKSLSPANIKNQKKIKLTKSLSPKTFKEREMMFYYNYLHDNKNIPFKNIFRDLILNKINNNMNFEMKNIYDLVHSKDQYSYKFNYYKPLKTKNKFEKNGKNNNSKNIVNDDHQPNSYNITESLNALQNANKIYHDKKQNEYNFDEKIKNNKIERKSRSKSVDEKKGDHFKNNNIIKRGKSIKENNPKRNSSLNKEIENLNEFHFLGNSSISEKGEKFYKSILENLDKNKNSKIYKNNDINEIKYDLNLSITGENEEKIGKKSTSERKSSKRDLTQKLEEITKLLKEDKKNEFDKYIEKLPDNYKGAKKIEMFKLAAIILAKKNDFQQADIYLNKAKEYIETEIQDQKEKQNFHKDLLCLKASNLFFINNPQKAVDILENQIFLNDEENNNIEYYFLLGKCYEKLKNFQKRIFNLKKALEKSFNQKSNIDFVLIQKLIDNIFQSYLESKDNIGLSEFYEYLVKIFKENSSFDSFFIFILFWIFQLILKQNNILFLEYLLFRILDKNEIKIELLNTVQKIFLSKLFLFYSQQIKNSKKTKDNENFEFLNYLKCLIFASKLISEENENEEIIYLKFLISFKIGIFYKSICNYCLAKINFDICFSFLPKLKENYINVIFYHLAIVLYKTKELENSKILFLKLVEEKNIEDQIKIESLQYLTKIYFFLDDFENCSKLAKKLFTLNLEPKSKYFIFYLMSLINKQMSVNEILDELKNLSKIHLKIKYVFHFFDRILQLSKKNEKYKKSLLTYDNLEKLRKMSLTLEMKKEVTKKITQIYYEFILDNNKEDNFENNLLQIKNISSIDKECSNLENILRITYFSFCCFFKFFSKDSNSSFFDFYEFYKILKNEDFCKSSEIEVFAKNQNNSDFKWDILIQKWDLENKSKCICNLKILKNNSKLLDNKEILDYIETFFTQIKNMLFLNLTDKIMEYYKNLISIVEEKKLFLEKYDYLPKLYQFYTKMETLKIFDDREFSEIISIIINENLCIHDFEIIFLLLEAFRDMNYIEAFIFFIHKHHKILAQFLFKKLFFENFQKRYKLVIEEILNFHKKPNFAIIENTPLIHNLKSSEILKISKKETYHFFHKFRYFTLINKNLEDTFKNYFSEKEIIKFKIQFEFYCNFVKIIRNESDSFDTLNHFQDKIFFFLKIYSKDFFDTEYIFLSIMSFVHLINFEKNKEKIADKIFLIISTFFNYCQTNHYHDFIIAANYIGNHFFKISLFELALETKKLAYFMFKKNNAKIKIPEFLKINKNIEYDIISYLLTISIYLKNYQDSDNYFQLIEKIKTESNYCEIEKIFIKIEYFKMLGKTKQINMLLNTAERKIDKVKDFEKHIAKALFFKVKEDIENFKNKEFVADNKRKISVEKIHNKLKSENNI